MIPAGVDVILGVIIFGLGWLAGHISGEKYGVKKTRREFRIDD